MLFNTILQVADSMHYFDLVLCKSEPIFRNYYSRYEFQSLVLRKRREYLVSMIDQCEYFTIFLSKDHSIRVKIEQRPHGYQLRLSEIKTSNDNYLLKEYFPKAKIARWCVGSIKREKCLVYNPEQSTLEAILDRCNRCPIFVTFATDYERIDIPV